jgi:hypothetical protein
VFTVKYELYYSHELPALEGFFKRGSADTGAVNRRIVQTLGVCVCVCVWVCVSCPTASFQILAYAQVLRSSGIGRYVNFAV